MKTCSNGKFKFYIQQCFIFYFSSLANASTSDRKDLLSELNLMKQLKPHHHVIRLLGCVTEDGKHRKNSALPSSLNFLDNENRVGIAKDHGPI